MPPRINRFILTSFASLSALMLLGSMTAHGDKLPARMLLPWEQGITGVASELMRRSAHLKSNYGAFMQCIDTPGCDPSIAIASKPEAVRDAWARSFNRLLVEQDWAVDADPYERMLFFGKLREIGPEALRQDCLPRISYATEKWRGTHFFTALLAGFDCSAAGSRRRFFCPHAL